MTNYDYSSFGDSLGTARRKGSFEPNSPEWHELRASGIGGSEVAAVVGCSPWKSAFTLWAERTKRIDREVVDNESVEWGTLLEPVIADKFRRNHPELKVYTGNDSWMHVDRPWQISNPDGVYLRPDGEYGILEIKTAAYEDDWKRWTPENGNEWVVPVYYRTQVQWYLQTFGFKFAIVAVLFGGRKYIEIELEADEFEQELNLATVERFNDYVRSDIKPEWDGSTSTLETVRKMHPQIEDTQIELGEVGLRYNAEAILFAEAERRFNKAKSSVLDAMGKAKRGTINGVNYFTRTSRNGGTPYLTTKKN